MNNLNLLNIHRYYSSYILNLINIAPMNINYKYK